MWFQADWNVYRLQIGMWIIELGHNTIWLSSHTYNLNAMWADATVCKFVGLLIYAYSPMRLSLCQFVAPDMNCLARNSREPDIGVTGLPRLEREDLCNEITYTYILKRFYHFYIKVKVVMSIQCTPYFKYQAFYLWFLEFSPFYPINYLN